MAVSATTVESEVAYFLGYGYASNAGGSTGDFLNNIAQRAIKDFLIPTPCRASLLPTDGLGSVILV